VIPVDLAELPAGTQRRELIGPDSGFPECPIACCRIAPLSSPHPPLTLRMDRLVFALSGEIAVQLGREPIRLQPRSLLRIPQGVPHSIGNTREIEATCVEIRAPGAAPSDSSGARADLTQLLRTAEFGMGGAPGASFEYTFLASRALGSESIAVNIARVPPGHQGPDYHIHTFDQFYFVLEGRLTVDIGFHRHEVAAPSLVILPAGVVHRQRNEGSSVEEHLAILCPEPPDGERLDHQIAMPAASPRRSSSPR
jgi:mannose-6-phosphate isomerase-like protein (cupin superfamily)